MTESTESENLCAGFEHPSTVSDLEGICKRMQELHIRRVKLGVTDVDGVLRGKYISLEKFRSAALSELGFCNVVFGWDINDDLYQNSEYTGWHTGYPDAVARIDLSSFRRIPWEPGTAFFLLNLCDESGEPLPICPRNVLRRVLTRAGSLGYTANLAAEIEFWLFRETAASLREKNFRRLTPISFGNGGYSVLRASANAAMVAEMIEGLEAFGIPLEGFHTETGPGAYEAALAVESGLRAADNATLFKTAVKEIAARHALLPTFMAKWSEEVSGSGGHIHQSLWEGSANVFAHNSRRLRNFVSGLIANMPALMAVICPTINSYKRTVPGRWAPSNASWGVDNRTTAVRVIGGNERSSRVELRLPGADMNPYLAMAASLAAGIDGIERQLETDQSEANGYESTNATALPRNLAEANRLFRTSDLARDWFGPQFVEHYARTREWEVSQYEKAVTDWELTRYFESI
jgi:glutamine synthetase